MDGAIIPSADGRSGLGAAQTHHRRVAARGAGRFLLLLWRALGRLRRHWPAPVLLGLGYANLGWGLAAHPEEMRLATRIAVDVVHANFGLLLGAALVCGSAVLGRGRSASGVVARAVVLVAVAAAALALAVAVAMLAQAWRGDAAVDLAAYGLGVWPGLGARLAQLAALAVFAQSLLRGWPGAGATAAACSLAAVLAHFGPESLLLPFASPPMIWSDMAGFGPFLPAQVAAGVAWSAFAVLLLVAAHWIGGRRRPTRGPVAVAWVAGLLAAVAGGWLLTTDGEAPAAGRLVPSPPSAQLRYHRLALDLEIYPRARRVAVQGVAILAHAGEAALADLHFALPAGLVLDAVQVTGERLPSPPRTRRFRLNRPLEPGETLRLGFTGRLQASAWPGRNEAPRLLANGTAFALAEILPIVTIQPPMAQQLAYLRTRAGTSLEQVVVAPGERRGTWREEGRSYYELETSQPVPLAATIHAGRYLRIEHRAGVVAFVHPPHRRLVERLLVRGAPATPTRLVEVPDLSRAGPVPGLGALAPPSNRAGRTAAGIVPISELAIVSGSKVHFD